MRNTCFNSFSFIFTAGKKAAKASGESKASTATMVTDAFNRMKYSRKGHTLAAIRNFIAANYDCEVLKAMQNRIKKFIGEEFAAGRIKMVNAEGEEVNFTKRFALVKN